MEGGVEGWMDGWEQPPVAAAAPLTLVPLAGVLVSGVKLVNIFLLWAEQPRGATHTHTVVVSKSKSEPWVVCVLLKDICLLKVHTDLWRMCAGRDLISCLKPGSCSVYRADKARELAVSIPVSTDNRGCCEYFRSFSGPIKDAA